jgi:hypothetical protein
MIGRNGASTLMRLVNRQTGKVFPPHENDLGGQGVNQGCGSTGWRQPAITSRRPTAPDARASAVTARAPAQVAVAL